MDLVQIVADWYIQTEKAIIEVCDNVNVVVKEGYDLKPKAATISSAASFLNMLYEVWPMKINELHS